MNTSPDEFKFQIEHCGVAIVIEDHVTANETLPHADRIISSFTVTAYSPSIGFEGATMSAKLLQSTAGGAEKTGAAKADEPVPNL
ncbi:MAG: hypothetical protein M3N50_00860 [Pseudomonadota bacterium]|nr:hypothetical protein [Pseudomonadota bacterium]